MSVNNIKKRIKKEGLISAGAYYGFKIINKVSESIARIFVKSDDSNIIVFKNRQGQDFSDNARALFEYMMKKKMNKKYQIVWLVSKPSQFKHKKYSNVKFVKAETKHGFNSIRAYYYANKAKFFFYTNNTACLNKHHIKEQCIVNLWHGCGYKGSTHKNKGIKYNPYMEAFDYALVPGEIFVDLKANYWECDKDKILPLGYPRYDWFNDKVSKMDVLGKMFDKQDISADDKLVLWMPTFRKTNTINTFAEGEIEFNFGIPLIESVEQLKKLNKLCEEKHIMLLIKRHPIAARWIIGSKYSKIKFIDDNTLEKNDVLLYHLIRVSDALVSDYSSAAVDFMLLDRPIAFVLSDYEVYKKSRGFVFEDPQKYMPGDKLYQPKDLHQFIEAVAKGKDTYKDERKKLMPVMHNETKCYSERIVEYLNL